MKKITIKMNGKKVELEPERILANNVIFPGEYNPHNVRLWVIGNEFGAVGAVWADCEQDALDELVDSELGNSFLIDKEDFEAMDENEQEDVSYLGNASEPANLDYAWMETVNIEKQSFAFIVRMAEARGGNYDNLDF